MGCFMKQERSPRFPFISLEEALIHLGKLSPSLNGGPVSAPEAVEALGYSGPHGGAVKVLAAMAAYDLILKQRGMVSLTATGQALAKHPEGEDQAALLRRAALSPMPFRRIWRRVRNLTWEEQVKSLVDNGFTENGAERAIQVYHANSQLAGLAELEEEPELPERGPKARGKFGPQGALAPDANRPEATGRMLRLPLSSGVASVPPDMTTEDFQLLMGTLRLWKERLVRK